jgi:hypothetical protein
MLVAVRVETEQAHQVVMEAAVLLQQLAALVLPELRTLVAVVAVVLEQPPVWVVLAAMGAQAL